MNGAECEAILRGTGAENLHIRHIEDELDARLPLPLPLSRCMDHDVGAAVLVEKLDDAVAWYLEDLEAEILLIEPGRLGDVLRVKQQSVECHFGFRPLHRRQTVEALPQ